MRYYVVSDIHGFYTPFRKALEEKGFFSDSEAHKLIVLGDLFDRGPEAMKVQSFIVELLEQDEAILIRGNHEDLFVALITEDRGFPYRHHVSNGTFDTALQLTCNATGGAKGSYIDLAREARRTPLAKVIIPAMLNYYETANYVFTHGWLPGELDKLGYHYFANWRDAEDEQWAEARWFNGMTAIQSTLEEKTVVCGHWHTSFGHCHYESHGSEFGEDADFSPYFAPGIIAIDACTAHSGKVNCIVIDD